MADVSRDLRRHDDDIEITEHGATGPERGVFGLLQMSLN